VGARAEQLGVAVRSHRVIYDVIDQVKQVLEENIPPRMEDVELGSAEVQQVFTLTLTTKERKLGMTKHTNVAGARVTVGELWIGAKVRVRRGEEVVFEGKALSIRHFKEEVSRVKKGSECGVILSHFGDFKVGDVLSFFEVKPRKIGLYDAEPGEPANDRRA